MRQSRSFVEAAAARRNSHEIAGDAMLHLNPSFGFDFLPETSLQSFSASRIFPVAAARVFAPHGAARHQQNCGHKQKDRQAILHGQNSNSSPEESSVVGIRRQRTSTRVRFS